MMKKTLFLSALALGLIGSTAGAVTANELAGKKAWVRIFDSYLAYGITTPSTNPTHTAGDIEFTPVASNKVKIKNFIDPACGNELYEAEATLTINGNNFTITDGSVSIPVCFGDYYNGYPDCLTISRVKIYEDSKAIYVLCPVEYAYNSDVKRYTWGWIGEYISGTIVDLGNGEYRLQTKSNQAFDVQRLTKYTGRFYKDYANNTTNGTCYIEDTSNCYEHSGFSFTTYTPNANVTDDIYSYEKNSSFLFQRNYTANVSVENNVLTITNFSNAGAPGTFTTSGTGATYDSFSGKMDFNTHTANIKYATTYMYLYGNNTVRYYLSKGYPLSDIPVSFTDEVKHYGSNRWLDSPENGTAQLLTSLSIDTYIGFESSTSIVYDCYYENTKFDIGDGIVINDLTHGVDIKATSFGYGIVDDRNGKPYDDKNYIYINASLENMKNSQYVESYELYIMPTVTNPDYNSNAFADEDKGHINGTRIDLPEYFTYYPNYPADKKAAMSKVPGMDGYEIPENPFEGNVYNVLIPEDALTLSDPNQKYSLYVKTIYTPESGLEPTFHALTALTNNPTGVESIIDNGENDDAPVYFYNMNGVQVDGNNLTPGLYIRRQGATSTKVLIK